MSLYNQLKSNIVEQHPIVSIFNVVSTNIHSFIIDTAFLSRLVVKLEPIPAENR